jgi:tetratricopeptide (TPR) repeat protein
LNNSASTLKGDSLYTQGNYFEASIEYERLIFQTQTVSDINYLKYRKALCYKKINDFDQALNELQPIYFSNPADSLYRLVCYEQSLCFYLNGEPARALWKIDEFFHRSTDSASFQFFLPIRILCLNETFQWDEAENSFLQLINIQNFSPEKKTELEQTVTNLYGKKNRPRIKSVKKAEILSRFFPGSGQIYAADGSEGIINFLINASVLTFTGCQVYNGFYITGYLAGLGFFNKTYHGGIKRAGVVASEKNKELIINFNRKVSEVILSDFELD